MIVTQLLGGLGNQLFQYAIGRALAAKHNTELRLDMSLFSAYPLRPYALGHFNIEGLELCQSERKHLGVRVAPKTRLGRLLQRLSPVSGVPVIRERGFTFDPEVLNAPKTCYLEGYWQSPKYFAAIEQQIRDEFTVRELLSENSLVTYRKIKDCLAVSLHVRRGDYVNDTHTNRYHGTCSADYYAAAEELIRDRFGPLRVFVFSDDPHWAQENLRLASPFTIVSHNGPKRDYEDLRLMTHCAHHIVANSTFSWWGAWLCANPEKLVIAPKDWFREAPHKADDLIPGSWIRM